MYLSIDVFHMFSLKTYIYVFSNNYRGIAKKIHFLTLIKTTQKNTRTTAKKKNSESQSNEKKNKDFFKRQI